MKFFFLATCVLSIAVFSCSSASDTANDPIQSPVDSLRSLVMDLHNLEMGKMGQMKMMKRELSDSLDHLDSVVDADAYNTANEAIQALDEGTFSMNSWMRNWSEPDTTQSVEAQLEALKKQQTAMERTSETMRSAIQMAQQILHP